MELAESGGLQVHEGRVVADAQMRTSAPNVFAAGDVALARNASVGRPLRVEHWGDALSMGELAGRNAAGQHATWAQVPGFWTTIGDQTAKYAAWGDGFDDVRIDDDGAGWTAWYGRAGRLVGVLTVNRDEDYQRGTELIENGRSVDDV